MRCSIAQARFAMRDATRSAFGAGLPPFISKRLANGSAYDILFILVLFENIPMKNPVIASHTASVSAHSPRVGLAK